MLTEDKLVRLFKYSYPYINEGYLGSGDSTFLVVSLAVGHMIVMEPWKMVALKGKCN